MMVVEQCIIWGSENYSFVNFCELLILKCCLLMRPLFILEKMQPSGEYRTNYIIETQYRNYVSFVDGWGWDKDFDLDYVIKVA